MNIYDISKKSGVSIATVSRVLNGSDKVKESTREKVLAVMEETGYMPNAFARSLGLNSMHTVGILCADSSDIYLAQAIYYLERELRKNNYASMLCCTGYDLNQKQEYLQLLLSRNVDAIILAGSHFVEAGKEKNQYLLEAAKKVPVFILNGHLTGANLYSILCDDYKAVFDMTSSILARGSQAPIYLSRFDSYSGKRKLAGFGDACACLGTDFRLKRSYVCPSSIPAAVRYLKELEQQGILFDSIIASDDALAVGAVKYAQETEKHIPCRLQISGYNNSLLSLCTTPALTTVDNQVEFLCTSAVSLLMQVFAGKQVPQKTLFEASMVYRETTLPYS